MKIWDTIEAVVIKHICKNTQIVWMWIRILLTTCWFTFSLYGKIKQVQKKENHNSLQMYIDISQIGLSKIIKICAFLLLLAVEILLDYK